MDTHQTSTKGQPWLMRYGFVTLIIAILLTTMGFVHTNASATSRQSSFVVFNPPVMAAAPSQIGDDTTADFYLGSSVGCSYVTETINGELSLLPTVGVEFSGETLPPGWGDAPWVIYQPDGSSQVSGGVVSIDESFLATNAYYSSGHVLDFVATLQPDVNDHAGLVDDLDTSANWAVFSMGSPGGSTIKARTMVDGTPTETDTAFSGGSPHHFRIMWSLTQVIYYIDDMIIPVATHDAIFTTQLRPGFSDLTPDTSPVDHTKTLVVDWVRMTPYTSPCTFTSRVLDAGSSVNWLALNWTTSLPAGTDLVFSYQVGGTASPDTSWSSFIVVPSSGATIAGQGRYVRYRIVISTSDPSITPEVQEVHFTYSADADATAPTILSRSPDIGMTNVSRNSDVSVTFSELLNPSTVNGSSVFLRIYGTNTDVPATVALSSGNVINLHPTAALVLGMQYTMTIKSSVADLANNLLGSDDVWNFSTTFSLMDTSMNDFQAGTGCYQADTSGGEISLMPSAGAEFDGMGLPVGWSGPIWGDGGSVVVGEGIVSVENARVYNSSASFTPEHSLEFIATFNASPLQHIGWVVDSDFNSPWAIFSTFGSTTNLFARTSDGTDTPIDGNFIGSPHRYRIDWSASAITFYIDGGQVAQHNVAITENMIPIVSDASVDEQPVQVNWIHILPYTSPCTFTSRVLDAGSPVPWVSLSWVGSATGIALSYRAGNTSTPDGTWTTFTDAPNSPTTMDVSARYIQYKADLSTNNPAISPVLESVTFTSVSPNYHPVITQGTSTSVTMSEDGDPNPFTLTLNTTDLNAGDMLTWTILTQATNGTASASGSGTTIMIGYTPSANYFGSDSFAVQVSDGNGGTDSIMVNVTITSVNDAPIITEGASINVNMSANGLPTAFSLILHATDVDLGDTLTWSISIAASNGSANASGTGVSKVINYTPTTDYVGSDNFVVQVSDGNGGIDTISVNVNISVVEHSVVGNAGMPGVTITYTGGSTITDGAGNFTFTVPYGWSGTVTPSLPGYVFTPPARLIATVTSDVVGVDFTANPIAVKFYSFLPIIKNN